jgi:hypothetical protein
MSDDATWDDDRDDEDRDDEDPEDNDAGGAVAMTEAEAAFAARLAVDLERVLGPGLAVADLEIAGDGPVAMRAAIFVDGMVREIEATGETSLDAYRALMVAAAELRLGAAYRRIVGGE